MILKMKNKKQKDTDSNTVNTMEQNVNQKKHLSKGKKILLISSLLLLCIVSAAILVFHSYSTRVYAHCIAEAGTEVLAEDFLKQTDKSAEFISGDSLIDTSIPGDYHVKIKSGIFTYQCTVTIQDTITPKAELKKVYIEQGDTVTPEDFITSISDMTKVTASFEVEPDYSIYGEQKISVLLTDLGGNTASYDTALVIRPTKYELTIEAGEAMPALADFLLSEQQNAAISSASPDTSKPGDYEIEIAVDDKKYTTILHIKDTVAPELELRDIDIYTFQSAVMEDFIVSASDISAVTCNYVTEPDFSIIGTQQITIRAADENGNAVEQTANLTLRQDMAPPELVLRDISVYTFESVSKEDFIVSASDISAVTSSYVTEPDFNFVGTQQVTIRATDESGNSVDKTANFTRIQDTEPPVISGAQDIVVYLGEKISYRKGVTVYDNCGRDVNLSVDNSLVNINAEGIYPVTYVATDVSGNQTVQNITVTVRQRVYDEAEIYELADNVLAGIITEGMSPYEKLIAIYRWMQSNIREIDYSEKGNWLKAAYEGFVEHKGDCYVYASVSQALLTRAGIANMMINRIPTSYQHYWNLVDIGEGWTHFDTCPRLNHPYLCYVDDATLMQYSRANFNSHNYDRTIYTNIR